MININTIMLLVLKGVQRFWSFSHHRTGRVTELWVWVGLMSHSYLGVDLAAASCFFWLQSVDAYGPQLHLLATEKVWIVWATGDLSERLFLENIKGWRCVAGLVKVCIWLKAAPST